MDQPILVDSNVYISLLRAGRDPAVALGNRYEMTDLVICGMVRLEVLRGVKTAKVLERLGAFFDVLMNVPSDNRLWEEATELAWNLDRGGRTLPGPDLVIAASALRAGAAVCSFDRHFDHIPGLRVIRDVL
jgi:predicted nucleic acid-binding protein